MRIDPQDELVPRRIPPIQLLGVTEVRVPADGHGLSHLHHQTHRPVNPFHAPALAGGVARTIHQIKHLFGIGQAHDQRPITPNPFIRNVHPLFAFTIGPRDRPVHINEGLLEKAFRLHLPHRHPCPVNTLLQGKNILHPEAPRKISRRRWVRDPFRSQAIHEHLILSPQLDVFQSLPPS